MFQTALTGVEEYVQLGAYTLGARGISPTASSPSRMPALYLPFPEWGVTNRLRSLARQQRLPGWLPQSLIEWLARINRRYLALKQEKTNDTSE